MLEYGLPCLFVAEMLIWMALGIRSQRMAHRHLKMLRIHDPALWRRFEGRRWGAKGLQHLYGPIHRTDVEPGLSRLAARRAMTAVFIAFLMIPLTALLGFLVVYGLSRYGHGP